MLINNNNKKKNKDYNNDLFNLILHQKKYINL